MNHHQATGLLADYGAGRCGGRQLELLEVHLADCSECRDWVGTYRELSAVAAGEPAASAAHADSDDLALYAVDAEQLGDAAQQKLRRHLSGCAACRSEFEATRTALARGRQAAESPALTAVRSTFESPYRLGIAASVLLGLLVSVLHVARRADAPVAPPTMVKTILSGERLVEAERSMVVAAVEIDSGSAIVFRAGEMVAFDNGFVVGDDASFSVDVTRPSDRRRRNGNRGAANP